MKIFTLAIIIFLNPPFVEAQGRVDKEFAGIAADILNPDKLFEALKKNITIPAAPISEKIGDKTDLPNPKETLKEASPKLQEVNKDVKEETGVDFAKLIGWFAKVLKVFFLTVVDLLETVSTSMQGE